MSEQTVDPVVSDKPPAGEEQTKTFDAEYVTKLRAEAAKYRTEAKANADAAKKLQEIEAATASETEKLVSKTQQETEQRVRAEVTRDRVLDRIEVLAAKDFADPEDARLRLASHVEDFVEADGTVDADGIKAALTALLDSKPHLKAVKDDGRPKGDADQGVRPSSAPSNPRLADLQQIEADLTTGRRK